MTKTERLLLAISQSVQAGGGVYSNQELAFLIGQPYSAAFTKFLADCVKKGVLLRVAQGIYQSALTPPDPATAIYQTLKKLRRGVLNYISLESQLSYAGEISQVPFDQITVITKGRSGTFQTFYGAIEFTHTRKALDQISTELYFDPDINMYRASVEQAVADLKACNRNLHLLEK
ncbi:type IV toxin-antitoxin system AbiEi family antitoxin [Pelagibaculum spongiae]|uniref:Transcriptional regulator n=1 Tax=Pelagibaculum spongiae TaxID=2080658 RepID=A0A2V1GSY6_9GAMM|nr:hypothetical protein [Pelagibaculum spongiae]PVZ64483.1 hypothetical protein DC094_19410 [Pelagibaculum spongiae]